MIKKEKTVVRSTGGGEPALISVRAIEVVKTHVQLIGMSPYVCSRPSYEAKRSLLLPPKKKSQGEKERTAKHNPIKEFRGSAYTLPDDDAPTYLAIPGAAFKRAIASAAPDSGGKRAEIGRLAWVIESFVPVYGREEMVMSWVRNSDMRRTPDIRTQMILPEWVAQFDLTYVTPNLSATVIMQLISNAGILIGVGDGHLAMERGRFRMVRTEEDRKTFARIVKAGGRAVQRAAFESPIPHDEESGALLSDFLSEAHRRELKVESGYKRGNGVDDVSIQETSA